MVRKLGAVKFDVDWLSSISRPSRFMRSNKAVVGGACRRPAIAQAMEVRSINSSCLAKIVSSSESKPTMKAGEHPQAPFLDDAHLLSAVLAQVLELVRFLQGLGRGCLNADEDIHEVCLDHGIHQLRTRGQVDRRLGVERERLLVPLLPCR